MVQSAQRTGRTQEMAEHLDRMLMLLQGTPYEATAQQWKAIRRVRQRPGHVQGLYNPGRFYVDAPIVTE